MESHSFSGQDLSTYFLSERASDVSIVVGKASTTGKEPTLELDRRQTCVDGETLPAHKFVLQLYSPVLQYVLFESLLQRTHTSSGFL